MKNDELSALFEPLRHAEPPPELFERIAARASRRKTPRTWILRAAAALVGFLAVFPIARPKPSSADEHGAVELFERLARAPRAVDAQPERELLLRFQETQR